MSDGPPTQFKFPSHEGVRGVGFMFMHKLALAGSEVRNYKFRTADSTIRLSKKE